MPCRLHLLYMQESTAEEKKTAIAHLKFIAYHFDKWTKYMGILKWKLKTCLQRWGK